MHLIKLFWKPILWAFIVVILSATSGERINNTSLATIPHIDKIAHFVMYFVFTILILFDFSKIKGIKISHLQIIIYSLAVTLSYGAAMEWMQSVTSLHRSSDIKDFVANLIGALSAVLAYRPLIYLLDKLNSLFSTEQASARSL